MSRQPSLSFVPRSFVPLALATAVAAQCDPVWGATPGTDGPVTAIVAWDPDGAGPQPERIVIGGSFTTAGGAAAAGVAVWDAVAAAWAPLGAGFDGVVTALAAGANGELVAGGNFTASGGIATNRVAHWDGAAWQPLGAGFVASPLHAVRELVVQPDGAVVAAGLLLLGAGQFHNAVRWNGSAWQPMVGLPLPYPGAFALLQRANGDLLAGSAVGIHRWDGAAWQPFGGPALPAGALLELRDGSVVAHQWTSAGTTDLQRITRWDGSTWTQLGGDFLGFSTSAALAELPDGDLVVGSAFADVGGQPAANLARWDGGGWGPIDGGAAGSVHAMRFDAGGTLWVGGAFAATGAVANQNLARLVPPCPATVVTAGAGCPGSGGANLLTAVTLPWVDSTLRTRGTGLPGPAVVAVDTGLAPIVPGFPLASVFAEAPLGCDLHLVPLIVQAFVSTTGTVDAELFLPNAPPLVGVTFLQQWFPFAVGGAGFVEITATNALQLTAGQF